MPCGRGHQAQFVGHRRKAVYTLLSPVGVRRAYYHCAACQAGMIPKDRTLNIADTSFSPGVRRMIGRVGAKEPFDAGRRDLEALAGVVVTTKAVERWFLPRGTSSSVRQRASFVARCRMNLNHKLCLEPLHHGNCR